MNTPVDTTTLLTPFLDMPIETYIHTKVNNKNFAYHCVETLRLMNVKVVREAGVYFKELPPSGPERAQVLDELVHPECHSRANLKHKIEKALRGE